MLLVDTREGSVFVPLQWVTALTETNTDSELEPGDGSYHRQAREKLNRSCTMHADRSRKLQNVRHHGQKRQRSELAEACGSHHEQLRVRDSSPDVIMRCFHGWYQGVVRSCDSPVMIPMRVIAGSIAILISTAVLMRGLILLVAITIGNSDPAFRSAGRTTGECGEGARLHVCPMGTPMSRHGEASYSRTSDVGHTT